MRSYSVILMNYGGSVTSSNASLQITNVLPAIMEPTNQLVGVGTTAILAVTVTNGTPPFRYQWQVGGMSLVNGRTNGATISGATSNVLTISNVQLTNSATNYTVIVHEQCRVGDQFQCHPDSASVTGDRIATNPDQPGDRRGIECDLYCHRHRDGAFALPMVGRDEPGEEWRPDQWRDHQCVDHQQCADEQQRQLHGHRYEQCRFGDQFQCDSDGDEHPAGDRDTTDQPDERGGNDCDPGCHRDQRDAAVELPMVD